MKIYTHNLRNLLLSRISHLEKKFNMDGPSSLDTSVESSIEFLPFLKLFARVLLGFVVLYGLFVACWLQIRMDALTYAFYNNDRKSAPVTVPENVTINNVRKIIFVRHGESTWNETFNKSKNPIFFIPRLIKAAIKEISLIVAGVQDSWFLDSPLSHVGFGQAQELRKFLADTADKNDLVSRILKKKSSDRSILVASNLRRAISTCCAALKDRLDASDESVYLLSCLQEISPNPDTLAITPAGEPPQPSWIDDENRGLGLRDIYATKINAEYHLGNKDISSNGGKRMASFCKWVFEEMENRGDVIVVGHSLWFRTFFQYYLPKTFTPANNGKPKTIFNDCKTLKLTNAGVAAFDLQEVTTKDGNILYRIDPESIELVYGKFKKG